MPIPLKQVDQFIPADDHAVEDQHDQIQPAEKQRRQQNRFQGNDKLKGFELNHEQIGSDDRQRLRDQNPQAQTDREGQQADHHGFDHQDPGHSAFVHPHHQIQAKFFFTPPDQKVIGVNDQKAQNDTDKHRENLHQIV